MVLVWLVLAVVVAYAGVVAFMYFRQRHLLFHPNASRPDPEALGIGELGEIALHTADGLTLRAWYAPPSMPDGPVLAFFHGNAGSLDDRPHKLRILLDMGLGLMFVAWRGYSDNPGSPTEEGLYTDARAALHWLGDQGITPAQTIFYGESLGTAVAVRMATEMNPAALVLEAPPSSISDAARFHYPWLPIQGLIKDRFDSQAIIAQVTAPILIMHGHMDKVVPLRLGEKLHAAAPSGAHFWTSETAVHMDLYEHGAGPVVERFLRDNGVIAA